MSTESPEPEAAQPPRSKTKQAEPKQTDAPETPNMPVSQLIENATGYLGHSSWTAAGALSKHDPDEMMSVEAAKAEIEKWRETPLDDGKE